MIYNGYACLTICGIKMNQTVEISKSIYYCVGEPSLDYNHLSAIHSINTFLPADEQSVKLFKDEDSAYFYLYDHKTKHRGNRHRFMNPVSYNAIFRVEINPTQVKADPERTEDYESYLANRNTLTLLDVRPNAYTNHFSRINTPYIRVDSFGYRGGEILITNEGMQRKILETELDERGQALALTLLNRFNNLRNTLKTTFQINQFNHLETSTYHLMESMLTQPSNDMISDLTLIDKGMGLAWNVLYSPNVDTIKDLHRFIEEEAPGKTNYSEIWAGSLLVVASVGFFAAGLALTLTLLLPPVGVPVGLTLLFLNVVLPVITSVIVPASLAAFVTNCLIEPSMQHGFARELAHLEKNVALELTSSRPCV